MKKNLFTLLTVLITAGFFSPRFARGDANFFDSIKTTETSEAFAISLGFTKSENLKYKIRFFKKSIQVDINPAFIKTKKALKVNNEIVDEVQVYAFKPGVIRARVYLKGDGNRFLDTFRVRSEGGGLIFYLSRQLEPIKKGVEGKIVNSLDREILSALSQVTSEKKSVEAEKQPEEPLPETSAPEDRLEPEAVQSESVKEPQGLRAETPAVVHPDTDSAGLRDESRSDIAVQPPSRRPIEKKEESQASDFKREVTTLVPEFFKMAGALGIVLALIFFATAGAKKILSQNQRLFGNSQLVRVLSSTSIGVKKQITLVEVAGEVLVLGVSNENITMLMKMPEEDAANLLARIKPGSRSRAFPAFRKGAKKNSVPDFKREVEMAVKSQKLTERDEMIDDVAKSIREKIEILKKA